MSNKETEGTSTELLDEYQREKVMATIAELRLALVTAENFVGMIDYCEEVGVEASPEMDKLFNELGRLRYPDAPAGPRNDIWKVCNLFQRAQTVTSRNCPAGQQRDMERYVLGDNVEKRQDEQASFERLKAAAADSGISDDELRKRVAIHCKLYDVFRGSVDKARLMEELRWTRSSL